MLARVLPVVLPASAIGVFALWGNVWWGYLLCLASLGYVWRFRLAKLQGNRIARILVICAALVAEAHPGDGDPSVLVVASGLILIGLAHQEPVVKKAVENGRLTTANIRIARTWAQRLAEMRWVSSALALLTVLLLATVALRISGMVVFAGSLALALIVAGPTLRVWVKGGVEPDWAVREALEAAAPRFAVHFSAPVSSEYQLLMWLPYFERLGDPYVVVLREQAMLGVVAGVTEAPVVVAPGISDIDHVMVEPVVSVFYVNNGMKNAHCVRLAHLTHVQLLHGDSDKPSSHSPVTAMFDQIFVAGQAGIDRYARNGVDIPPHRFRIVGRPQIAEIEPGGGRGNAPGGGRGNAPGGGRGNEPGGGRPGPDPVVLYAPTWTGYSTDVNYCSLSIGEKIVKALLSAGATVILRHHPYTGRDRTAAGSLARVQAILTSDAKATGRPHLWGAPATDGMTLVDCVNRADAMICDVSGVAPDWLYSEKPFATTDMQGEGEAFAESFPLSEASYVVDADGADLDRVVQEMLGADPLAAVRREMKTYYLGDIEPDVYVERFLDAARRTYAVPREAHAAVPGRAAVRTSYETDLMT